jgi:hypothetical protein
MTETTFCAEKKVLCGIWWAIFEAIIRILHFIIEAKYPLKKHESEAYKVQGELSELTECLRVLGMLNFTSFLMDTLSNKHSLLLT